MALLLCLWMKRGAGRSFDFKMPSDLQVMLNGWIARTMRMWLFLWQALASPF
jgi:hypothetical protein